MAGSVIFWLIRLYGVPNIGSSSEYNFILFGILLIVNSSNDAN